MPEPGGGSARLVREGRARAEIDSTWRIYWKTWLIEGRHPTEDAAVAALNERFAGRLREGDWRVRPDPEDGSVILEARRWTVQSEWKRENVAREWREALVEAGAEPAEVEVVPRNGRREHVLQSYGVLKLAT